MTGLDGGLILGASLTGATSGIVGGSTPGKATGSIFGTAGAGALAGSGTGSFPVCSTVSPSVVSRSLLSTLESSPSVMLSSFWTASRWGSWRTSPSPPVFERL